MRVGADVGDPVGATDGQSRVQLDLVLQYNLPGPHVPWLDRHHDLMSHGSVVHDFSFSTTTAFIDSDWRVALDSCGVGAIVVGASVVGAFVISTISGSVNKLASSDRYEQAC